MVLVGYLLFFLASLVVGLIFYWVIVWSLPKRVERKKMIAFCSAFTLWWAAFYITSVHPFVAYYVSCGRQPEFKADFEVESGGGIRVEYTALSSVSQLIELIRFFGFVETETLRFVGIEPVRKIIKKHKSQRAWNIASIKQDSGSNCQLPIGNGECIVAERDTTHSPKYQFIIERADISSVFSRSSARLILRQSPSGQVEIASLEHSNYLTGMTSGPLSWFLPEWFNVQDRCSAHEALFNPKSKAVAFWQHIFGKTKE